MIDWEELYQERRQAKMAKEPQTYICEICKEKIKDYLRELVFVHNSHMHWSCWTDSVIKKNGIDR